LQRSQREKSFKDDLRSLRKPSATFAVKKVGQKNKKMINDELTEYAEAHTSDEWSLLAKLSRETHLTQVYPRMLAGNLQGTFLRMISTMLRPKRILEIGTFTGYSTINLAMGLAPPPAPSPAGEGNGVGLLHTIEVNPELEEIIRRYIHEAGLDDRIILHIGDALQVIPTLKGQWDLIYIDADKPNYLNYYKMLFDHLRPGGFFLADNALWGGKVIQPKKKHDKDMLGIVEFNEFVQQDGRVENVLLPVRDGIMLIQKK
jgi:caffeoyl-CoA O-methyltransferase